MFSPPPWPGIAKQNITTGLPVRSSHAIDAKVRYPLVTVSSSSRVYVVFRCVSSIQDIQYVMCNVCDV